MRTRNLYALLCAASLGALIPAQRVSAQACPPLPNNVTIDVKVSVSFDAARGLYTYAYTVANSASSIQAVKAFAIDVVSPVSNVTRPRGWSGAVMSGRSTVRWGALRTPRPNNDASDATVILPGTSLDGFSFQSPRPPGLVSDYAVGYLPPASSDEPCASLGGDENEANECADELLRQCPQLGKPILEQAATGISIGPVNATPVQVQVAIKPGSSPAPINPRSQGVLPVAILGSSSLDVRTIDASTVRLGAGQAVPRGRAQVQDVDGDGIPDLLLQFETQDVGVQCGDSIVVLSGNTTTGATVSGVQKVKTVGCPK
jgi:hypothetical protein